MMDIVIGTKQQEELVLQHFFFYSWKIVVIFEYQDSEQNMSHKRQGFLNYYA